MPQELAGGVHPAASVGALSSLHRDPWSPSNGGHGSTQYTVAFDCPLNDSLPHVAGAVGIYVPGGTAVLPSSALMLSVPAGLAGCKTIVLATPPRQDGCISPEVKC